MDIIVSGLGIVSSIGFDVRETLASLAAEKSGVGEIRYFDSAHKGIFPVAEVQATNDELKRRLGLPVQKAISRTALLGMYAAREAFEDAALSRRQGLRIGLISGTSVGGMDLSENFYADFLPDHRKGRLRNVVSHDCADSTERIARCVGATDYVTTISTACSSAANAIMLGAKMLKHNLLDIVIAGGTDALCKFTLNGFASLKILDEQPCRPLDNSRAGLNLGEGAAYLVLERATDNPAKSYCRVAGYANVCEAFHQTASSPEGYGAFDAMQKALKISGLAAGDIDYINFHGTGTLNNDLAEGNAVKRLFGEKLPALSSTKACTGHTLGASGGIEAVFSALAIEHGLLLPNLRFSQPVPEHGLVPVTRFESGKTINAVLSNSFGFGGNDSTLIFAK